MINQNNISLRKGNSGEIMIELKKTLEKEIILKNKKEIIIKIKELIMKTLEEKDFFIYDGDWLDTSDVLDISEKHKNDSETKKDLMLETLKDQDYESDMPIDDWLDQITEYMESSSK
jgi:hypothetical protein